MNKVIILSPPLGRRPAMKKALLAGLCCSILLTAPAVAREPANQSSASAAPRSPRGISFSFVNAPLAEVVATIVGDGMGRPYTIAPSLDGRISLATDRPISPKEALARLDVALRDVGAQINVQGQTVQVVPYAPPAPSQPAPPPEPVEEVVAVGGVDPAALLTVLRAMLPPDISASLVPEGIRLVGPTKGRKDAAELIRLFDTQLGGRAFTMVQLESGAPADVIKEVETLFPRASGAQFMPIERAGAILVVGDAGTAAQAVKAVQALDQGGSLGNRQLFIYPVAHGRASDLARVLGGLYGTPVETDRDSAANQRPGLVDPAYGRARTPAMSGSTAGGGANTANANSSGLMERPAREANAEEALAFGNDHVRIVADERSNSLAVLASRGEWRLIQDFLRRLDVQPMQIYIEATIAEVTLNDRLEYGLQWFFRTGNFTGQLSDANNGSVTARPPGFSGVFDNLSDVRVVLDALKAVTKVNVISSPQLTVLNNQTATLQVGADVPVATRSAVSVIDPEAPIVNNIEFRPTGVILRVTPRANAGGMVTVDIEQEVSDVVTTDTSNLDSPTIQQRRVESTVAVRSGETIALAGLIQNRDEQGSSGLPILSRLPVIGGLFGTKTRLVGRTELLVLMTPRLIVSSADVHDLTEELRARLSALPPVK